MGIEDSLKGQKIYLDSNVFIYTLEGFSDFKDILQSIFMGIENSEITACTSEIAIAEVLVKPISNGNEKLIREYTDIFEHRESFEAIPVTRTLLIKAAKLRAKNGFKLPDAIHMATALAEKCSFFLTNDKRFGKTPGIQPLILSEIAK